MISAGENEISSGVSCYHGLPFTVGSVGSRMVSGDNAHEIGAALISGNQNDRYLDMAVVPVSIRTVKPWAWPGEGQEITVPSLSVYHLRLKMDSLERNQQIIASRLKQNFFIGKGNILIICSGLNGHGRSFSWIVAMDNGK